MAQLQCLLNFSLKEGGWTEFDVFAEQFAVYTSEERFNDDQILVDGFFAAGDGEDEAEVLDDLRFHLRQVCGIF